MNKFEVTFRQLLEQANKTYVEYNLNQYDNYKKLLSLFTIAEAYHKDNLFLSVELIEISKIIVEQANGSHEHLMKLIGSGKINDDFGSQSVYLSVVELQALIQEHEVNLLLDNNGKAE